METFKVSGPAAPGNNATVVLFDSTVMGKGKLRQLGVGRITFSFPGLDQASAANGLAGFASGDGGITWKSYAFPYHTGAAAGTLPVQVTADTGSTFMVVDVPVALHSEVKFTYTAGASGPTAAAWNPVIILRTEDVHVVA